MPRWGYRTLGMLEAVVQRYHDAGIPLEAVWADIDHMDRFRDFTYDPQRYPQPLVRKFVDRRAMRGKLRTGMLARCQNAGSMPACDAPTHACACALRLPPRRLHTAGQRFVPIVDCGIPVAPDDAAYTSGLEAGVFVRDVTEQPYIGQVCVRRRLHANGLVCWPGHASVCVSQPILLHVVPRCGLARLTSQTLWLPT